MFHWAQRVKATQIRLGDTDPEHDTPIDLIHRALASSHTALGHLLTGELDHLRQTRRHTPHDDTPPTADLRETALAFVQLCAAFALEPEQVIEDAVQRFEARKRPTPATQQPTAPTANDIQNGAASRQFTL